MAWSLNKRWGGGRMVYTSAFQTSVVKYGMCDFQAAADWQQPCYEWLACRLCQGEGTLRVGWQPRWSILCSMRQAHWWQAWMSWPCQIAIKVSNVLFFILYSSKGIDYFFRKLICQPRERIANTLYGALLGWEKISTNIISYKFLLWISPNVLHASYSFQPLIWISSTSNNSWYIDNISIQRLSNTWMNLHVNCGGSKWSYVSRFYSRISCLI